MARFEPTEVTVGSTMESYPESGHDYGELRSKLQTAVRRTCPPWLADQAEDLVQVSLVRILRKYPDAELNTSFLYRVAHSVVVDEIRRRRRRQEVGMTPSMPERLQGPDQSSPELQARGAQIGEVIVDCLGTLVPDRKRAVTLYLQGHGVPEISELLGFDRKKSENLVYRGLKDLRGALSERGMKP